MSRKHYERFAAMFSGEMALARVMGRDDSERAYGVNTVGNLIRSTADIFAQDNPRFDRARFYAASGLGD